MTTNLHSGTWHCSECGHTEISTYWQGCPKCGSDEWSMMRQYHVTLTLTVTIPADTNDDDLEDAIAYEVEQYSGQAVMVDYTEVK